MMNPVKFASSGNYIRGYFFPAAIQEVIATAVFLQGFPGVEGDELICGRLARVGINVLTFNYRGTFQSEGHFTFQGAVDDIGAALRYLGESDELEPFNIDADKIILGGWSFGASLVPTGVIENPGFGKFFLITGRNFAKEARKIDRDREYARQAQKNLEGLRSPNGPLNMRNDMLEGLIELQDKLDLEIIAPKLKDYEILLIGGWDDDVAPIEDHILPFYRTLLKTGSSKVRIEAVQDNHEFSNCKDQIVQIILDWMD